MCCWDMTMVTQRFLSCYIHPAARTCIGLSYSGVAKKGKKNEYILKFLSFFQEVLQCAHNCMPTGIAALLCSMSQAMSLPMLCAAASTCTLGISDHMRRDIDGAKISGFSILEKRRARLQMWFARPYRDCQHRLAVLSTL